MIKQTPHRRVRLLALLVPLLQPLGAEAHEFWVMPSAFVSGPNSLVRVELYHGERFAGDLVPRDTAAIERFDLVLGGETTPVRGMHAATTGFLRPEGPGSGVIVYQTREYIHVLPGPRFEAYLAEEGLDLISERRADLGETSQEGREAYVRCAKALVAIAEENGTAAPHDTRMGLPFEIVLDEPADGLSGGALGATILFQGEPVEGLRVVAVGAADPRGLIELTSDPQGHVAFTPDEPGAWMLTSLHMVREDAREDVDWKSYWASLTFSLPEGGATRPALD